MKTYNVPESFILEAHKEACDKWKKKIEGIAPDLFPKFKVGDWVYSIHNEHSNIRDRVVRIDEIDNEDQVWCKDFHGRSQLKMRRFSQCYRLATKEEIEKHLIAEAEKRGFKEGVKYSCAQTGIKCTVLKTPTYYSDVDQLTDGNGGSFYLKGVWAKILPAEKVRLTLEDIAKLKGVDVSLIEIVK